MSEFSVSFQIFPIFRMNFDYDPNSSSMEIFPSFHATIYGEKFLSADCAGKCVENNINNLINISINIPFVLLMFFFGFSRWLEKQLKSNIIRGFNHTNRIKSRENWMEKVSRGERDGYQFEGMIWT